MDEPLFIPLGISSLTAVTVTSLLFYLRHVRRKARRLILEPDKLSRYLRPRS